MRAACSCPGDAREEGHVQAVNTGNLVDRMIRASKGDVNLYEEVERDETAMQQAVIVVAIVSLASALGAAVGTLLVPAAVTVSGQTVATPRPGFISTFLIQLIIGFVVWYIWSYATFFVGTRMFGGTATPGEMLRTIGFAQSPRILGILSFIPVIGGLIGFALFIWSIYIGFIAVRQGLDLDTQKSIFTIIISFIVALVALLVVSAVLGLLFAPLMMMGV
jgi:hypothetical protein